MKFLATLLLGLCLLGMPEVRSQNILWERRLSWPGIDLLYDVVSLDSNNYMAIGISERLSIVPMATIIWGITLVKFDQYGDTMFVKHMGGYYSRGGALMCKGEKGVLYVYSHLDFSPIGDYLFKLDYNGNILARTRLLPDIENPIVKLKMVKDSTLVLTGLKYGSPRDSMLVIKMTRNGVVLWKNTYSGGGTITWGQYLEETPNGTYLASGTTSSNIWAVELDSNGNQLRQGLLYRNSQNQIFTNVAVQAAPDNRFIAAGNFDRPTNFYLGSHDGLTNNRYWGGEKIGETIPPFVNNDGSIVFYYGTPTNLYLSKIDADSTPIWQVSIYNRLAPGCFPRAISYLSDSSAVLVGYTNDNNSNLAQDFYIARISGVGVPYDPTTPVATRPQLGSRGGISIWPQPASHANGGTLHFIGFAGPATLGLYNMKGQQVLLVLGTTGTTTTTLLPRQPVPIGHLPAGLYVYRLVAKDRVWTGKVVIGE